MPQPNSDCSEFDGGEIVVVCFVISGCHCPEVFEFVEETFHQVAGFVKNLAEDWFEAALGHGRDVGPGAFVGNGCPDGIRIVCAIRQHHGLGLQMFEQSMGIMAVIGLTFGQDQINRQAQRIYDGMDLGRQPAARAAHATGSGLFFLPLAAC